MKRWSAILMVVWLAIVGAGSAYGQDVPGTIAYVGTDFNIYTTSFGGEAVQLTTDAGVSEDRNRLLLYQVPTWASDGRLAYFATTITRDGAATLGVWVSPDGAEAGEQVHQFEGDTFTYAMWAPSNCGESATCRDLALLLTRPGAGGFVVELVRDGGSAELPNRLVGSGAPFYFSWSPDAARMLWHRNNGRIDLFDLESDAAEALTERPGAFSAPAWSPVDDRLLYATRSEGQRGTTLLLADGESEMALAEGMGGPVYFAWSPDGSMIAYTDGLGALTLLDASSGETVAVTPAEDVLAFFWSPDSQRIAFLTTGQLGDSFDAKAPAQPSHVKRAQDIGIAWSIFEVSDGTVRSFGTYVPTEGFVYLLTYFDQFAQSHALWSPDSRHLVYAELLSAEREVIRVLDTADADNVAVIIGDGSLGIWSPR